MCFAAGLDYYEFPAFANTRTLKAVFAMSITIIQKAMKKGFYVALFIFLLIVLVVSLYAIFNIGVSIKYETNNNCISVVDSTNLCALSNYVKIATLISGTGLILLLAFKRKISKYS